MSEERGERVAAVQRYAQYAERRRLLDAVLAEMDGGDQWRGNGLSKDEIAEIHSAAFCAARNVVVRWREEASRAQKDALEFIEEVTTAADLPE